MSLLPNRFQFAGHLDCVDPFGRCSKDIQEHRYEQNDRRDENWPQDRQQQTGKMTEFNRSSPESAQPQASSSGAPATPPTTSATKGRNAPHRDEPTSANRAEKKPCHRRDGTALWPGWHPAQSNGWRITMVSSRSGPVEMISIGVSHSSSTLRR